MEFIKLLLDEKNVLMQYETAAMLLMLMLPALKLKDRKKLAAVWTGVFLFFIYLHRALLPFVVSGIYFFILAGIADCVIFLKPKNIFRPFRLFAKRAYAMLDMKLLPCTAVILLILMIQLCRMNVSIDYDSLRYGLRSDVLLSDSGISGFFKNLGLVNTVYVYPKGFEVITLPLNVGHSYGYVLSFNVWIFIAVIMLAGETAKFISGENGMRAFSLSAMLTSLVPGISNMALTAKSDLITLLCQVIFIQCAVIYISGRDSLKKIENAETLHCAGSCNEHEKGQTGESCNAADMTDMYGALSGMGAGALMLSLSFKPTALVFSSVLGIAAAVFFIIKKIPIAVNKAGIRAFSAMLAFTLAITLRTLLISGQPFCGVFSGLFAALGFRLRYPFAAQQAVSGAETLFTPEHIKFFISRLIRFFFCPVGDGMEHVIMAWGGLVFVIMLLAAVILRKQTARHIEELSLLNGITGASDKENGKAECTEAYKENSRTGSAEAYRLLIAVLIETAVLSLVSLFILYQADGNYFELWYITAVIAGAVSVSTRLNFEESELGKNDKRLFAGNNGFGIIALTAASVYITAFTGWNGAAGFTPAKLINRGYYNHEVEYGIKNPLGWDRHTRVTSFAKEPECYKLKGRVESYVDIAGSCGNVGLVKTLDLFKEYLSFADIDYIYADLEYLNDTADGSVKRAAELFRDLLEDGSFEETVLEENSSTLLYCKIDKERAAESWQVPMGEQREHRTEKQKELYYMLTK